MASRLRGRVAAVAAAAVVAVLAVVLAIVAAGNSASPSAVPVGPTTAPTLDTQPQAHSVARVKPKPLRAGESRMSLRMESAYHPAAPNGVGTDDYRCFVLDPHLTQDRFLTGTFVKPDNPDVVHHVILFRVDPDQVAAVKQLDAKDPGEGWTCFGDSGLPNSNDLNDAPWLGAWAPGGQESVDAKGYGVPLPAGSRIIMQVHYNLLAGSEPDRSSALLRLASPAAHLTPISTMLLPAPVELPCRPGHTDSLLCDRTTSVADVVQRFGPVGQTANWLNVLCGEQRDTEITTCTRTIQEPTTIRAVAGHMHLLGRSIKIQVNPGRPNARTVLDIPTWDFDNQGARPVKPVHLAAGDTVRVTCRHDQRLRDLLPALKGQPDKYVLWGEGTTDEMCLGILLLTRP